MRDAITILLTLLAGAILSSSHLLGQFVIDPYKFAAGAPAPTYLLEEDMEGTGTPAGWTDTSTPNWDYTTAPILGAESWSDGSSPAVKSASPAFTATSPCYVFFAVTLPAGGINGTMNFQLLSNTTVLAGFEERGSGAFRIHHGTIFATSADTPGSAGGTFFIWLEYTLGSGTNGVLNIYWSSTQTKPGSPSMTGITTGTSTLGCNIIRMQGMSAGAVFDKIRVDDVAIGSNPL